jgi:hypothetical protein
MLRTSMIASTIVSLSIVLKLMEMVVLVRFLMM